MHINALIYSAKRKKKNALIWSKITKEKKQNNTNTKSQKGWRFHYHYAAAVLEIYSPMFHSPDTNTSPPLKQLFI